MALLNYSAPYLATPNPPTANYYQPPQPLPHLPPLQGPYSYPPPQKPFLAEEFPPDRAHRFTTTGSMSSSHNSTNPIRITPPLRK
ncbi:hypothetical protein NQ317_004920 [Molorchus minor]|uniref:Uncharacterized protein n=1 Tax=Molorchus minor TaxID=1323400 RepID=A0ABQ9JTV5_9CUCU|nr:hypothetical protein NQ317_004920 [Molorchus minor]